MYFHMMWIGEGLGDGSKAMAPVFVRVKSCDCCGGDHADVELFGGYVPHHVKVWHDLPFDDSSSWYLCPAFGYAVIVVLSKLPMKKERGQ